MRKAPEILLVAPYDVYPSIERFAACLEREVSRHANVRVFRPKAVLGRFSAGVARKWCSYVDKFLVAPQELAREMRGVDLVHLTDQSLAIYARCLGQKAHLVNCNDLIAVRAALGELPEFQAGHLGKQLQKRILRGLSAARHAVCLSASTRGDLLRLTGMAAERASVIPMGLHFPYVPMEDTEARQITMRFLPDGPFLLHVGGNQWYKNRRGVLAIYRELVRRNSNPPNLALIGEPLTQELRDFVQKNGMRERVFVIDNISDNELRAFYSTARALLFPSFYEGFGWPIIEAQACGCPVLTTDRAPMNEVGGSGALFLTIEDPGSAAETVSEFLNAPAEAVATRRRMGFQNVSRFSTHGMIESYLALYAKALSERQPLHVAEPAFA